MYTIINDLVEKFKTELIDFFEEDKKTIKEIEEYCSVQITSTVLNIISAYYEEIDRRIYEDKKKRKEEGLIVERKNESRNILTNLGLLNYTRTYYQKSGTDDIEYTYPVDDIAGIKPYQRISETIENELVNHAIYESYQRSADNVAYGYTSKQTVMNKIRASSPEYIQLKEKKRVSYLHIDADEDHVHLQKGGNTIVPLASVYEGIVKTGRRGKCKNIFHISSYGESTDDFWEKVLNQIEAVYDISETKIYIHGDGAEWIKRSKEWFPNSVYCLDKYHANKYIKQSTAGMSKQDCKKYQEEIKTALREGTFDDLAALQGEMIYAYPERYDGIVKATSYLLNNFDSIRIYSKEEESLNGGATEPHVSHVLSARLSSRPMGWSEKTLERFVPLLAAKLFTLKNQNVQVNDNFKKYGLFSSKKKKFIPNSLGLPNPDISISMACEGKNTPLRNSLLPFFRY